MSGPVILGFSGASGAPYGLRLLQCLLDAGRPVWLLVSPAAQVVLAQETDWELPARPEAMAEALRGRLGCPPEALRVFGQQQWMAPVASGSHQVRDMVICPCSAGTVSALAQGTSSDLMERAADVMIKERRRLLLVVRETPLSPIHLENLLKLARLGVTVMPASPGFYHRPRRVEDLVDFVVARVLDHLDVPHALLPRWGAPR